MLQLCCKASRELASHTMILEKKLHLYGRILSFPVTNVVTKTMKHRKGCKLVESEDGVVSTPGGLSDPKAGMVPIPEAGLLEFNTEGGVP